MTACMLQMQSTGLDDSVYAADAKNIGSMTACMPQMQKAQGSITACTPQMQSTGLHDSVYVADAKHRAP